MRVIEGENELRLTCSRSASGGIALLRCETQDDIVRLPDEIDGVPVTEVGAYVLSERAPELTGQGHVRCPYYLRRHGAEAQCGGYPHGYAPEGCKKCWQLCIL